MDCLAGHLDAYHYNIYCTQGDCDKNFRDIIKNGGAIYAKEWGGVKNIAMTPLHIGVLRQSTDIIDIADAATKKCKPPANKSLPEHISALQFASIVYTVGADYLMNCKGYQMKWLNTLEADACCGDVLACVKWLDEMETNPPQNKTLSRQIYQPANNTGLGHAIVYAAARNHVTLLELFSIHTKTKNLFEEAVGPYGLGVAHAASFNGHTKVLDFLTTRHKDCLQVVDGFGRTGLMWSCFVGDEKTVDWWLTTLDSSPVEPHFIDWKDDNGSTALHFAAAKGHIDIVKSLFRRDCDMMTSNACGMNAILHATAGGHSRLVEYLHQNRFQSIHSCTVFSNTVLHLAAAHAHLPILKYCLQSGSPTDPSLLELVELQGLVDWNIPDNSPTSEKTGLHLLAAEDVEGDAVIHVAAYFGRTEIVQWLCDLGVVVDVASTNGSTALIRATQNIQLPTVQLLLEKCGAQLLKPDSKGSSALEWAQYRTPKGDCIIGYLIREGWVKYSELDPDYPIFAPLLEEWKKEAHHLFPRMFKEAVCVLLWIQMYNPQVGLRLPVEVIFQIVKFAWVEDFARKRKGTVRQRRVIVID